MSDPPSLVTSRHLAREEHQLNPHPPSNTLFSKSLPSVRAKITKRVKEFIFVQQKLSLSRKLEGLEKAQERYQGLPNRYDFIQFFLGNRSTSSHLALRQRQELRNSPLLINKIVRLWSLVTSHLYKKQKKRQNLEQLNVSRIISKDIFLELHMRISKCLPFSNYQYRACYYLALVDWECLKQRVARKEPFDGESRQLWLEHINSIKQRKITQLIFEEWLFDLADFCVLSIDVKDYIIFLDEIFRAISHSTYTGEFSLRKLETISFIEIDAFNQAHPDKTTPSGSIDLPDEGLVKQDQEKIKEDEDDSILCLRFRPTLLQIERFIILKWLLVSDFHDNDTLENSSESTQLLSMLLGSYFQELFILQPRAEEKKPFQPIDTEDLNDAELVRALDIAMAHAVGRDTVGDEDDNNQQILSEQLKRLRGNTRKINAEEKIEVPTRNDFFQGLWQGDLHPNMLQHSGTKTPALPSHQDQESIRLGPLGDMDMSSTFGLPPLEEDYIPPVKEPLETQENSLGNEIDLMPSKAPIQIEVSNPSDNSSVDDNILDNEAPPSEEGVQQLTTILRLKKQRKVESNQQEVYEEPKLNLTYVAPKKEIKPVKILPEQEKKVEKVALKPSSFVSDLPQENLMTSYLTDSSEEDEPLEQFLHQTEPQTIISRNLRASQKHRKLIGYAKFLREGISTTEGARPGSPPSQVPSLVGFELPKEQRSPIRKKMSTASPLTSKQPILSSLWIWRSKSRLWKARGAVPLTELAELALDEESTDNRLALEEREDRAAYTAGEAHVMDLALYTTLEALDETSMANDESSRAAALEVDVDIPYISINETQLRHNIMNRAVPDIVALEPLEKTESVVFHSKSVDTLVESVLDEKVVAKRREEEEIKPRNEPEELAEDLKEHEHVEAEAPEVLEAKIITSSANVERTIVIDEMDIRPLVEWSPNQRFQFVGNNWHKLNHYPWKVIDSFQDKNHVVKSNGPTVSRKTLNKTVREHRLAVCCHQQEKRRSKNLKYPDSTHLSETLAELRDSFQGSCSFVLQQSESDSLLLLRNSFHLSSGIRFPLRYLSTPHRLSHAIKSSDALHDYALRHLVSQLDIMEHLRHSKIARRVKNPADQMHYWFPHSWLLTPEALSSTMNLTLPLRSQSLRMTLYDLVSTQTCLKSVQIQLHLPWLHSTQRTELENQMLLLSRKMAIQLDVVATLLEGNGTKTMKYSALGAESRQRILSLLHDDDLDIAETPQRTMAHVSTKTRNLLYNVLSGVKPNSEIWDAGLNVKFHPSFLSTLLKSSFSFIEFVRFLRLRFFQTRDELGRLTTILEALTNENELKRLGVQTLNKTVQDLNVVKSVCSANFQVIGMLLVTVATDCPQLLTTKLSDYDVSRLRWLNDPVAELIDRSQICPVSYSNNACIKNIKTQYSARQQLITPSELEKELLSFNLPLPLALLVDGVLSEEETMRTICHTLNTVSIMLGKTTQHLRDSKLSTEMRLALQIKQARLRNNVYALADIFQTLKSRRIVSERAQGLFGPPCDLQNDTAPKVLDESFKIERLGRWEIEAKCNGQNVNAENILACLHQELLANLSKPLAADYVCNGDQVASILKRTNIHFSFPVTSMADWNQLESWRYLNHEMKQSQCELVRLLHFEAKERSKINILQKSHIRDMINKLKYKIYLLEQMFALLPMECKLPQELDDPWRERFGMSANHSFSESLLRSVYVQTCILNTHQKSLLNNDLELYYHQQTACSPPPMLQILDLFLNSKRMDRWLKEIPWAQIIDGAYSTSITILHFSHSHTQMSTRLASLETIFSTESDYVSPYEVEKLACVRKMLKRALDFIERILTELLSSTSSDWKNLNLADAYHDVFFRSFPNNSLLAPSKRRNMLNMLCSHFNVQVEYIMSPKDPDNTSITDPLDELCKDALRKTSEIKLIGYLSFQRLLFICYSRSKSEVEVIREIVSLFKFATIGLSLAETESDELKMSMFSADKEITGDLLATFLSSTPTHMKDLPQFEVNTITDWSTAAEVAGQYPPLSSLERRPVPASVLWKLHNMFSEYVFEFLIAPDLGLPLLERFSPLPIWHEIRRRRGLSKEQQAREEKEREAKDLAEKKKAEDRIARELAARDARRKKLHGWSQKELLASKLLRETLREQREKRKNRPNGTFGAALRDSSFSSDVLEEARYKAITEIKLREERARKIRDEKRAEVNIKKNRSISISLEKPNAPNSTRHESIANRTRAIEELNERKKQSKSRKKAAKKRAQERIDERSRSTAWNADQRIPIFEESEYETDEESVDSEYEEEEEEENEKEELTKVANTLADQTSQKGSSRHRKTADEEDLMKTLELVNRQAKLDEAARRQAELEEELMKLREEQAKAKRLAMEERQRLRKLRELEEKHNQQKLEQEQRELAIAQIKSRELEISHQLDLETNEILEQADQAQKEDDLSSNQKDLVDSDDLLNTGNVHDRELSFQENQSVFAEDLPVVKKQEEKAETFILVISNDKDTNESEKEKENQSENSPEIESPEAVAEIVSFEKESQSGSLAGNLVGEQEEAQEQQEQEEEEEKEIEKEEIEKEEEEEEEAPASIAESVEPVISLAQQLEQKEKDILKLINQVRIMQKAAHNFKSKLHEPTKPATPKTTERILIPRVSIVRKPNCRRKRVPNRTIMVSGGAPIDDENEYLLGLEDALFNKEEESANLKLILEEEKARQLAKEQIKRITITTLTVDKLQRSQEQHQVYFNATPPVKSHIQVPKSANYVALSTVFDSLSEQGDITGVMIEHEKNENDKELLSQSDSEVIYVQEDQKITADPIKKIANVPLKQKLPSVRPAPEPTYDHEMQELQKISISRLQDLIHLMNKAKSSSSIPTIANSPVQVIDTPEVKQLPEKSNTGMKTRVRPKRLTGSWGIQKMKEQSEDHSHTHQQSSPEIPEMKTHHPNNLQESHCEDLPIDDSIDIITSFLKQKRNQTSIKKTRQRPRAHPICNKAEVLQAAIKKQKELIESGNYQTNQQGNSEILIGFNTKKAVSADTSVSELSDLIISTREADKNKPLNKPLRDMTLRSHHPPRKLPVVLPLEKNLARSSDEEGHIAELEEFLLLQQELRVKGQRIKWIVLDPNGVEDIASGAALNRALNVDEELSSVPHSKFTRDVESEANSKNNSLKLLDQNNSETDNGAHDQFTSRAIQAVIIKQSQNSVNFREISDSISAVLHVKGHPTKDIGENTHTRSTSEDIFMSPEQGIETVQRELSEPVIDPLKDIPFRSLSPSPPSPPSSPSPSPYQHTYRRSQNSFGRANLPDAVIGSSLGNVSQNIDNRVLTTPSPLHMFNSRHLQSVTPLAMRSPIMTATSTLSTRLNQNNLELNKSKTSQNTKLPSSPPVKFSNRTLKQLIQRLENHPIADIDKKKTTTLDINKEKTTSSVLKPVIVPNPELSRDRDGKSREFSKYMRTLQHEDRGKNSKYRNNSKLSSNTGSKSSRIPKSPNSYPSKDQEATEKLSSRRITLPHSRSGGDITSSRPRSWDLSSRHTAFSARNISNLFPPSHAIDKGNNNNHKTQNTPFLNSAPQNISYQGSLRSYDKLRLSKPSSRQVKRNDFIKSKEAKHPSDLVNFDASTLPLMPQSPRSSRSREFLSSPRSSKQQRTHAKMLANSIASNHAKFIESPLKYSPRPPQRHSTASSRTRDKQKQYFINSNLIRSAKTPQ